MGTKEEEDEGFRLLAQLEIILDQDPLIDEVAFVHPSQLATLHPLEGKGSTETSVEEQQQSTVGERNLGMTFEKLPVESVTEESNLPAVDGINRESIREASYDNSVFWSKDHKLAISLSALIPLYKAAKCVYLVAFHQYKNLVDSSQNVNCLQYGCEVKSSSDILRAHCNTQDLKSAENELLSHSRIILLLSCDYSSAWNSRKQVISHKRIKEVVLAELQLSALVLSYAPKSEQAWSYRVWLIKLIINEIANSKEAIMILEKESDLVERIAERSQMNYRAWSYRCWLVRHMSTPQVLIELHRTKMWAESHVADNCCFHYRRDPRGAPFLPTKKKDGTMRMCIDYRSPE
eukprot:Gb_11109 [translate_table: standard]